MALRDLDFFEGAMSTNYFMSDAFLQDAAKAVREAVAKADALGLPKACSPGPELPERPVIVPISEFKTKSFTD
jgi:hypothetical protein